jgi:hypothetical protein
VTGRSIIALVSAPSGFAGRTKPVQVGTPQWHDTEPVNQALERVLGVPTSVLRLVSAKSWETNWLGEVTYHVEAHGEPNRARLFPAGEPEADAPRRLPWARPGGPAELVAWADAAIDRTGPAAQVKTWHMSSVHRLPTAAGPAWLKAVPPFLADEGRVIRMVAAHDPALVPEVIASAPHRVLLGDAPGGDCWKVEPEDIERIVPRWVAVQHALAGEPREPGLRSSVVPMPSFGLPDTVVHGDFSPINWTRNGVVLGWSSAVWGHPALDVGRLLEYCRRTPVAQRGEAAGVPQQHRVDGTDLPPRRRRDRAASRERAGVMTQERPNRSIIALVSTPSGFAGRTDVIEVETPNWNHVEPINTALRELLGVETSVLRLVSTDGGVVPFGGTVTYHVEARGEPDRTHLHPAEEPEPDAEHRLPWARLGGPAELVAWADTVITRTGPAVQIRTWNLSCVHRLPTTQGPVWLKAVPPFFADEGSVIKMVAAHDPTLVPELLASAPNRVLLSEAEGGNCWHLTPEMVEKVVPRWVAVQHALAGEPRLPASVVPMPSFGLPDTLTHGDFHGGNWRDSGVVIDWSDACWGHPALDACRLMEFHPGVQDVIARVWSEAWLTHRPDSEPLKALEVARRASRLHNAVKYQEFLDNIEESERVYHEGDPQTELRAVRQLVR